MKIINKFGLLSLFTIIYCFNTNAMKLDFSKFLKIAKEVNLEKDMYDLLTKNTCLNGKKNKSLMNIFQAIATHSVARVAELIADVNFPINQVNEENKTPLMCATTIGFGGEIDSSKENILIIAMLLRHPNLDINKADNYGHTALRRLICHGDRELLKIILGRPDLDVNKADNTGETPLCTAIWNRLDLGLLDLLLKKGAIKVINKSRHDLTRDINVTPLANACSTPYLPAVKLLLENGAFVDDLSIEYATKYLPEALNYLEAVINYDDELNKKNFIDGYANDTEIYSLLIKIWLDSKKQQPLFECSKVVKRQIKRKLNLLESGDKTSGLRL